MGYVVSVEFLGLVSYSKLNWLAHIDQTCKRLWRALFSLRRVMQLTTQESAKISYYAHFHGVMTYGILAWGLVSDASRVFIFQKKALRIIFSIGIFPSINLYIWSIQAGTCTTQEIKWPRILFTTKKSTCTTSCRNISETWNKKKSSKKWKIFCLIILQRKRLLRDSHNLQ